ncbi:MAG: YcxB family protein [Clostridia bacterium]|nr:YcxB family protein [Clostridia bacterium]
MQFKFNVNLTDNDYLEYNRFWNFRSHYGRGQIISMRIMVAVILGIFMLVSLAINGFSADALIGIIPLLIVLVLMELFLKKFIIFSLKANIKSLRKKGKVGYSPNSTIEFYDETFTEATPETKTEQKYSSIERLSVVKGRALYFHVNSLMAYILPIDAFENKLQYDSFMEFITGKINTIDYFDPQ